MCQSTQNNEQKIPQDRGEQRDVDDLIFCHESQWMASDR